MIIVHLAVISNQEVFNDNVRRVKQLQGIAEAHNTSIANVVLAFYLTRPALDV